MTTQLLSTTASGRMMGDAGIVSCRNIAMVALILGCAGALQLLEGYLTEEHYVMLAFCGVAYYALEKQGTILGGVGKKKKIMVPRFVEQGNPTEDQTEKQRPKKSSKEACPATDQAADSEDAKRQEARMNSRIRDLVRAGELKEAVTVFGMMMAKKVTPNLVSYNSLIRGFAMTGELATAEEWLSKAHAAGHVLDVYSYAPLVKAYLLRRSAEAAGSDSEAAGEAWLRKMRDSGVAGDVALYNLVLEAKARSSAPPAKVDSWLFQMLEDGPAPDTASFNAAMKAWSKSTIDGSADRVEAWFKRMRARKIAPDFHSYQNLILANGKAGKVEKAAAIFRQMVEDGVPPHPSCYAAMLQVYGDAKKFDDCWALLAEMKRRGVSAVNLGVYQALLKPIAAAGDLAQVAKVVDEMRKDGFDPQKEPVIVGLWVTAYTGKDVQTPCKLVEEAVKAGTQVDQFVLNCLERAVGPQITEGVVKKLKLQNKGWKPKEWRAVSFSHTAKKFTSSSEHKIIRSSRPYSILPTTSGC